jgi:transcriptional regulator with GAF, ATPase, and Fis domain
MPAMDLPQDKSESKQALENSRPYRDLEDHERKIRRLVDANILGVFIWNLEDAIVEANEAFLRMVQYSREDALVTGETGTGKELVARAIHRRSDRALRAFVSVNFAAIPRDLIASEFFGHEKGAFTGAIQKRLRRFELASGDTLFLDEVGDRVESARGSEPFQKDGRTDERATPSRG